MAIEFLQALDKIERNFRRGFITEAEKNDFITELKKSYGYR